MIEIHLLISVHTTVRWPVDCSQNIELSILSIVFAFALKYVTIKTEWQTKRTFDVYDAHCEKMCDVGWSQKVCRCKSMRYFGLMYLLSSTRMRRRDMCLFTTRVCWWNSIHHWNFSLGKMQTQSLTMWIIIPLQIAVNFQSIVIYDYRRNTGTPDTHSSIQQRCFERHGKLQI